MKACVAALAVVVLASCGGGGKSSSPTAAVSTTTEDPHARPARVIDSAGLRHGYTAAELSEVAAAVCQAAAGGEPESVMAKGFDVERGWTSQRVYAPSHGGFNIPGSEVAKMDLAFGRVVCPQNNATLSAGADQLANSRL